MWIAAGLIELQLERAESIKARRRVANAVKDRLRQRFNVSVAEVADQDDRHSVCVGCVMVGIDPRHLRNKMDKIVRYVESLGLADSVDDDIEVFRLDEIEPWDGPDPAGDAPAFDDDDVDDDDFDSDVDREEE